MFMQVQRAGIQISSLWLETIENGPASKLFHVLMTMMGLKQLLIVFQKFIQNIHSREQQLMDGEKDARKTIFTLSEKKEDQILWTMNC